jgi:hypothetical protein
VLRGLVCGRVGEGLDWCDVQNHARQLKLGYHLWTNYPRVPVGAISELDSSTLTDQSRRGAAQVVLSSVHRDGRVRVASGGCSA